jgi:hypothetical protein
MRTSPSCVLMRRRRRLIGDLRPMPDGCSVSTGSEMKELIAAGRRQIRDGGFRVRRSCRARMADLDFHVHRRHEQHSRSTPASSRPRRFNSPFTGALLTRRWIYFATRFLGLLYPLQSGAAARGASLFCRFRLTYFHNGFPEMRNAKSNFPRCVQLPPCCCAELKLCDRCPTLLKPLPNRCQERCLDR